MPRLTPQMQKLLSLLQRLERDRRPIAGGELVSMMVDEVGYKDSTARTYRSKILDGKVLFAGDDEGTVVVRHAVAMSGDAFAAMMTQTKPEVSIGMECETEDEWRDALEVLARHGVDRGYKLAASERATFESLFDRPASAQRQLFDN
jgi:hypothetical protein